ncbi:MAG: hypothetical protein R6W68_08590 [Ignavibacteriaceae bacterium]
MKLLISLILIISSPVLVFPQECKTGIRIITDISNIRIFINDSLEYVNQFEIELEKGSYEISVLEDSDRWDAKSFHQSFQLDTCRVKDLSFSFKDELLIDSNPQDAKVFSGDSLLGYTPLFLSQKFDRLTLAKDGFAETEILVDQHKKQLQVSLKFIGELKKESFFDKSISKILFGSMIVLGVTTAYYKIKADNNYEEYLRTGDIKFKNKTDQYDLISGITLGAAQINFGYLIYKIFSDN